MNNKNRWLFVLTLILMISSLIILAQEDNDPATNPDANACYAGGSLAGTCSTTDVNKNGVIDDGDIEWMWTCGWYLIRAEQGMISADDLHPEGCNLPPEIVIHKIKEPVPTPTPTIEPRAS